jgi:hypothetical protein
MAVVVECTAGRDNIWAADTSTLGPSPNRLSHERPTLSRCRPATGGGLCCTRQDRKRNRDTAWKRKTCRASRERLMRLGRLAMSVQGVGDGGAAVRLHYVLACHLQVQQRLFASTSAPRQGLHDDKLAGAALPPTKTTPRGRPRHASHSRARGPARGGEAWPALRQK